MCFAVIIRAPPTSCIPVSVSCLGEDSLSSRVHPLNDKMVQNHLLLGPLHDVLLHTALGHQSVDVHLCGVCVECGVCEGVECVWSV